MRATLPAVMTGDAEEMGLTGLIGLVRRALIALEHMCVHYAPGK